MWRQGGTYPTEIADRQPNAAGPLTDIELAARPEAMAISVLIAVVVIVVVIVVVLVVVLLGAAAAQRSIRGDTP